jgi:excisionase family DNA binding protein
VDLQTAADRLGVHYQTAYRWIREGSLKAVKRGAVYDVEEDDLLRFQAQREAPAPPPRQATVRSWDHQVARLEMLLRAGDELGSRQLVDRLREGGIDPLTLCEDLFTPVLRRIGDAWACGEVSVAEEHRASAMSDRLLTRVAVHPRGRPRGVCVVGTLPGEEHGLPATMAAIALRADRWQVHHLGTQVPVADLIDLVRTLAADLVVVSASSSESAEAAGAAAERVRAETGVSVLVGTPGAPLRGLLEAARGLR